MAKDTPDVTKTTIEMERASFRELLLTNPNYFGQLEKSDLKAQVAITQNTKYEELKCVGYNPVLSTLEATFAVKLAAGYKGSLCQAGSYEFVRFFLDYGSGWQDAGAVATNVHDIPVKRDCAEQPDRPLSYVATLHLKPKQDFCRRPVLPRVRAILSWDQMPTPGNPNFHPVWGNVHECNIQIQPRRPFLKDIFDELKIEVPKEFEIGQLIPIPIPDPPPFAIADIAKLYSAKTNAAAAKQEVEAHRFGMADLQTALLSSQLDSQTVAAKSEEWKAAGLNFGEAIGSLSKLSANVDYEEIECLGLDYNQEKLAATFRIKRSSGYGGPLCFPGSTEYVAFWSDWDDKCKWKFEGCVQVNVHDIQRLPDGGLCYSAVLPVDLNFHRQECGKPKIARIRAVLSWNSPPSTTNPDVLPYWGNRMDTHVQIRPGIKIDPGNPKPMIIVLGGVSVDEIDASTGLTTPGAKFALNNVTVDAAGRACPFAGVMVVQGPSFPGYKYRLQKRNLTLGTGWDTITDSFITTGWNLNGTVNHTTQTATGELFTFLPHQFNIDEQLGIFPTTGDDKWEIRMEIYTSGGLPMGGSDNHVFQLANTVPEVFVEIANGGNCKTFQKGQALNGTFFATAAYMGGWSLGTSPFAAPAGALTPTGGSVNAPAFTPWTLQTAGMDPCGYVLVIAATDRVIVNSAAVGRTVSTAVGFCVKA